MPPIYYSSSIAESSAEDTLFLTTTRASSPDPLTITPPPRTAPNTHTPTYNPHRPLPILSTRPSRASPSYNFSRILSRHEDPDGKLFYLVASSRPGLTRLQQKCPVEAANILKHVSAAQLEAFENERGKSEPVYRGPGSEETVLVTARVGRPRKNIYRDGSGSPMVVITARNSSELSSSSAIAGKRKSPTGARVEKLKNKRRRKEGGATQQLVRKQAVKEKDVGQEAAAEEDGEYEIERVLDSRENHGNGNGREYLVKWKGWREEFNQWLSEDAMGNADELVGEYWAGVLEPMHPGSGASGKEEEEDKRKDGIEVWV